MCGGFSNYTYSFILMFSKGELWSQQDGATACTSHIQNSLNALREMFPGHSVVSFQEVMWDGQITRFDYMWFLSMGLSQWKKVQTLPSHSTRAKGRVIKKMIALPLHISDWGFLNFRKRLQRVEKHIIDIKHDKSEIILIFTYQSNIKTIWIYAFISLYLLYLLKTA